MECLRDWDWGSVVDRTSLEMGDGVFVALVILEGSSCALSILEFVGTSGETSPSEMLAMRKPPRLCESERSLFILRRPCGCGDPD